MRAPITRWHHPIGLILTLWTAAGLLSLHAAPSPADASQLPPLESFFTESTGFAERISPCGQKVAYLGPDERAINRLWMVDVEKPDDPLKISIGDVAVSSFFWIGKDHLLWQCIGSDGRAKIHLTCISTGGTREILSQEKRIIRLEGVVDSSEPRILVGLSDTPIAFPNLYRVRLHADETPELLAVNDLQIHTWAWNGSGMPVGGLRWTASGAKELLRLRGSEARAVFRVQPTDDLRLLMASSDGSRVLVQTDSDSDFTHLEWINLATGISVVFGTDPSGRVDIDSVFTAEDEVLAASYSEESVRWHALDSKFSSVLEALSDPAGSQHLHILGIDESRKRILLKRFSGTNPGTLLLHDVESRDARIFTVNF